MTTREKPSEARPLPVLATSMWCSSRFALDLLRLVAVDQPLIDRIILIAIAQANLQMVTSLPEQQRAYASLHAVPPDTVRRPISINALAGMLRIPFETTRRHVRSLVAQGVCELTIDGARVPASAIGRADDGVAAIFELTKAMYSDLSGGGCLASLPPPGPSDLGVPPVRAVARLAFDHALRTIEAAASLTGNLNEALLMLTVWLENVDANIGGGIDEAAMTAGNGRWLLPDADRLPIKAAELAGRLGASESTVHRRLKIGAARGWCRISRRGAVVPADFLAGSEFLRAARLNHSNLLRLFNQLSRFGVLEQWNEARQGRIGSRRI